MAIQTLNGGEVLLPYLVSTSAHNSILGECRYKMAVINRLEAYSRTEGEFSIERKYVAVIHLMFLGKVTNNLHVNCLINCY